MTDTGFGGNRLRSSTRNDTSSLEVGGAGFLGRFVAGFAQWPRRGTAIPAFLQALPSATSETPISRASVRTGVDQTFSKSSRAGNETILCI
ncbi:hypothetical protein D3C81_1905510 [compost metagenome]